ncbi:Hypothetical predicted protein [Lecanosticta acicola]|uniref:DUF7730 domain-containing protein n=1 Tax=Lecanosticta acicola TaxID=111012 RepID=A0AAI8Z871_9PEZI|nr:Hypothetical predicted protein [Lecanosticta acicola]
MENTKTSFLDLPPEIRNTIYQLALEKSQSIGIKSSMHRHYERYYKDSTLPKSAKVMPILPLNLSINILRTCKTIHQEATPILYGANRFHFHCCCHFKHFAETIGGASLRYLRELRFAALPNRFVATLAFSHLKACRALEKLTVPHEDMYAHRRWSVPALRATLEVLGRCRGRESGRGVEVCLQNRCGYYSQRQVEDFSEALEREFAGLRVMVKCGQ